jgi:hypothetical protein
MWSDVLSPLGLTTEISPPSAAIRSVRPISPEPPLGSAPPIPSSRTDSVSTVVGALQAQVDH